MEEVWVLIDEDLHGRDDVFRQDRPREEEELHLCRQIGVEDHLHRTKGDQDQDLLYHLHPLI